MRSGISPRITEKTVFYQITKKKKPPVNIKSMSPTTKNTSKEASYERTLLRRLVSEDGREGFEKLLFHTDMIKRWNSLKKVAFGMEPTADYHKPPGEYLILKEHTVVLVAGSAVKNNTEVLDGRWDKNGTKDAANIANIANLLCQGKCLFY